MGQPRRGAKPNRKARCGHAKKTWESTVLKAHGHSPEWVKGKLSPASRAALRQIDLHFHDLRHEAASRLLEAGWPLQHVQAMCGHADAKTTSIKVTDMAGWISCILFLLQAPATADLKRSPSQSEYVLAAAVEDRLRQIDKSLPADIAKADATAISQAMAKGEFDRFRGGQDVKLDAAEGVWFVLRGSEYVGKGTGMGKGSTKYPLISVNDVSRVAAAMGRLVISSIPSGADISVDDRQWRRKTDADGYAYMGKRRVRVSKDGTEVGVTCEVVRDETVTVRVDLASRNASCK